MPALLEVRDVTIEFPHFTPVKDLSFTIEPASTLAIVGESGSGKSLTALALMRLLPRTSKVTSGAILLEGRDMLSLPDRDMRSLRGSAISMIFQEPMTSLNPVQRVGDQIAEVLQLHKKLSYEAARKQAIELLDVVRIPEPHQRADEYPHQFSGGMRQRVMIAMAVACRPRILIADEPTTALDVTIQAQVLELIDTLRRDLSMAVILITHDLGVVSQWADRVVVMYAGMKVEDGSPDEIFGAPFHPYTQGLLSAAPRLAVNFNYRDRPLFEIPGNIASALGERGCLFAPRCPIAIDSCRKTRPGLTFVSPQHSVACPVVTSESLRVAALGR